MSTNHPTNATLAPPPTPPRRRVLADLTPLRSSADYRRIWFGQSVSSIGQQMTAVAVAVQVYALTGSAFATGLVGLCSLFPLVGFGLYGGVIADRTDRRKLGLIGSAGLAVVSAVLAAQALFDLRQVGVLYACVALQGAFFAISSPARASMIPRLLPAEQLPAANALNTMSMNLGMTVGPMLGGVLIGAFGAQSAYLVDTIAFTAVLHAMWRLPAMRPLGTSGARASVLDGLRFLKQQPNLRVSFLADLAAMVFGLPRSLFPALAASHYGGHAGIVGLLVAAPAVGALAGALFSGWISRIHRHGLAILASVAAWGLSIAAFGLTGGHLWLGLLLLAVAGCSDTVSMVFRNTMLQVAAPDEMRGRLQGIFIVVVAGGPRLGDFESGTVAALTTPTISVITGGLACLACVLLLAARRPAFLRYDSRHPTP
ncbi:MFS transporter [Kitasatospora viridis]|uniref:Putative MFS family arabinose efflux permease n=1 Tax=Kitasatospora viridis TaxID=281105 RepID=A0A561UCT9_9ACTN|nr:MFS transporter [Kitasatospora viridis]TWF97166.1 putative MFS family arabinose efflux permease [Kitasatospora viridis]